MSKCAAGIVRFSTRSMSELTIRASTSHTRRPYSAARRAAASELMSAQEVISTPANSGALRRYAIEMLPHPMIPILRFDAVRCVTSVARPNEK